MPVKTKTKLKVPLRFVPPSPAKVARNLDKIKETYDRRRILKMAVAGKSYDHISEAIGMPVSEVFTIVKATVNKWITETSLSAQEMREMDIHRLEHLISQIWPDAEEQFVEVPIHDVNGKPTGKTRTERIPPNPISVKLVRDLMERKHKLLGLDAAQKMELSGELGLRREYVGVELNKL